MHYYEVAPTKIIRRKEDWFTYHSQTLLHIGDFVRIPVGNTILLGVVIRKATRPQYATRPVAEQLPIPHLPASLLQTILWMSKYYATPLATVLQTALPRGIQKNRRRSIAQSHSVTRKRTHFLLNDAQRAAVEHIMSSNLSSYLLHGVTGSGKTAVYLELIRRQIAQDKSALLLVPEIALTSQLVDECMHYFSNVVVFHSRQTESERHQLWDRVASSAEPVVAIGPRSALFLPIRSLGAIIIDEAHEPSYKQEQAPRYSALRAGSVLAKYSGAFCVMGSATPNATDYYLATQNKGALVTLPTKVHTPETISLLTVDMTNKAFFNKHTLFSDQLLAAIDMALQKKTQTLIFHNRRGSASLTLCEACGWSALCSRCLIPYTLHTDQHILRCHLCGNRDHVPTRCPICDDTDVVFKGVGTKRIETELARLYPTANIARFDGDTANSQTVEQRYKELYSGDIDIIIGTQVVAKGLDLPKLHTVGIVQADAGLALPDYGSNERTFQLLTQAIGRVGRSAHSAHIIVQSYQPSHPAIRYGIVEDFTSFYNATIKERRRALFPPFVYLLKLTCVYKTEATAIKNAKKMAKEICDIYNKHIIVLGPTPAFYEFLHGSYRWQLVIKSHSRHHLVAIQQSIRDPHWQSELDPISLL